MLVGILNRIRDDISEDGLNYIINLISSNLDVLSSSSTTSELNCLFTKVNTYTRSSSLSQRSIAACLLNQLLQFASSDFIEEKMNVIIENIFLLLRKNNESLKCNINACIAIQSLMYRVSDVAPDCKRVLAASIGKLVSTLVDFLKEQSITPPPLIEVCLSASISVLQNMPSACRGSYSSILGVALNLLDQYPHQASILLSSLPISAADSSAATNTLLSRLLLTLDELISTSIEDDSRGMSSKSVASSLTSIEPFTLPSIPRTKSLYREPCAVLERCKSLCLTIKEFFCRQ